MEAKNKVVWSEENIIKFWKHNESSFSGDTIAPLLVALTRKHIRGRILDVGAGSGALVSLLPGAVGIDVAPKGENIRYGSIDRIEFPDWHFQTVFATDVLEHLNHKTLINGINEVYRVLSPGGSFIATVPDREDMRENTVWCPCCQQSFHRWGHLNVFTESDIRSLLGRFRKVTVRRMPLGVMAEHFLVRYFWRAFTATGSLKANNMLVVAKK